MPEATQIQLGAERDIGLYELALAAARSGALGGALGGAGVRPGPVSYRDWLSGLSRASSPTSEAIFGATGPTAVNMRPEDFLSLAADWDDPRYRGRSPGYPGSDRDLFGTRLSPVGPDPRKMSALRESFSGRGTIDQPRLEVSRAFGPEGREGPRVDIHDGRHRAALAKELGYESIPVQVLSHDDMTAGPSSSIYGHGPVGSETPAGGWPAKRRLDIENIRSPMRRGIGKRAVSGLKYAGRAAKEAIRPKNIIADALIGSLVGAGSAMAGYEGSRPRSGGTFTAPGPGYEDALSKKDILEIAARKEAENEARRLAGIEKVNEIYGPGTLGPNARTADIANYLGPIR